MRNSVETITVNGSVFTFDHATGIARAKHANGYPRSHGYSSEAALGGYLILTDQWDRYEQLREETA